MRLDEKRMKIVYSSGIRDLVERNSSFDSGVLRVAYTGKNRNGSFISKETFERCVPSIYNCPIVCRYDRDSGTIGSHDVEVVSNDDGGLKLVNATHPVGVIPESARIWWELVEDDSGEHEYLCADALIWKRQEAYSKIKEDGVTDESMEISVKDGELIDGVYVIKNFEFTAFCLLGSAPPCFESASLEMFSYDEFKQELAEMMQEFKETFNQEQSPAQEGVVDNLSYSEGGENVLEEKNALMAEYGLSPDMFDFNIDDFSVEELREKFEAMKNAEPKSAKPNATNDFALEGQFREGVMVALSAVEIQTEWGEMSRYWFVDYDKDLSEVYCYDCEDWNLYGFSYAMNGDNVEIDFDSKKRMKFAIVAYDEGEQPALFAEMFAQISQKFTENNTVWEEKLNGANEKYAELETETKELRQFKADTEAAAQEAAVNVVLGKFAKLAGIEEFDALFANHDGYTAEALEEKCYAIMGRNSAAAKFSYEPTKSPKLPVDGGAKRTASDEPYGGVFAEYGFNSVQN